MYHYDDDFLILEILADSFVSAEKLISKFSQLCDSFHGWLVTTMFLTKYSMNSLDSNSSKSIT